MFSDLTKDRFNKFRKIKRAYYSLWILGVLFILSLFSEFIANDKPLFLRYMGKSYFPVISFYSEQTFGGTYKTEADYLALNKEEWFRQNGFMTFPVIPHSPSHAYLELGETPGHRP